MSRPWSRSSLSDVLGEPGALPIFQYALTELFDGRDDDRLTVASYRAMGGAHAVLSRRADDLYHSMTLEEQDATRSRSSGWSRSPSKRRGVDAACSASEVLAIDVDVVTMESVIDQLGRQRFLAFDRDHATGAPTVEVAHEALLTEWERLRGWIEEGRVDIGRRAALDAALHEWSRSSEDPDYLLTGKRLAEYGSWRNFSAMRSDDCRARVPRRLDRAPRRRGRRRERAESLARPDWHAARRVVGRARRCPCRGGDHRRGDRRGGTR